MADEKNQSPSLLEQWLKLKDKEPTNNLIEPRPVGSLIPLSHRQERLWVLQKLHPLNPFYHFVDAIEFSGEFDSSIFKKSLSLVINRHDSLKTNFVEQPDGMVNQVVQSGDVEFSLNQYELNNSEELKEIIEEQGRKPFDLAKDCLVRATVIKKTPTEHLVILVFHHIIIDKQSAFLLWKELLLNYSMLKRGEVPEPGKPSLHYGDFTYWERNKDKNPEDLEYWQRKLKDSLPLLTLPFDYGRPDLPSFKGNHFTTQLNDGLSEVVTHLCKQQGITPFVFFLSLFKIMLSRLSGEKDIIVGYPISERSTSQLDEMIGFFDDTAVIRSDLSQDLKLSEFWQSTSRQVVKALSHRNISFEDLVKIANPERNNSYNPIFQEMFIYHDRSLLEVEIDGLAYKHVPLDLGVSKFDLTLYVEKADDEFSFTIEYSSDLFQKETIEKFADYYCHLVRTCVDNANLELSSLSLLDERDENLILSNARNPRGLDKSTSILQLFSDIVKRQPYSLAVVDENKRRTYSELDEQSSIIADFLSKDQKLQGACVAIHGRASADIVAAIFGVMKSGNTYLYIDPELPDERKQFLIRDADCPLVLTDGSVIDGEVKQYSIHALKSDFELSSTELTPDPDSVAYIIYTSGSTGQPKGVQITNDNLLNSTLARADYYSENPTSFLLLSAMSFDSSVAGIFWTLTTGGKLVIPKNRLEQDLDSLGELMVNEGITMTLLLPSLYLTFLEYMSTSNLEGIDTVILAGESCPEQVRIRHFDKLPGARLFNEYGPSEATVWSTVYEIKKDDRGNIPIGKPIANAEAYVIDLVGGLAPVGVMGELYIGGKGISKGYLNRPELDEHFFIHHQIGSHKSRLYKTGDLATVRPDGNITFHGRSDQQVKVRGHRVELGEIEKVSLDSGLVSGAVAILENPLTAGSLTLFVVGEPEVDRLRQVLKDQLPRYMMPAKILSVNEIPRLSNGKVNRKQLAQISQSEKKGHENRTDLNDKEESVAKVWEEVLGTKIDLKDNFFEIGGDSIQSIRIVSQLREKGFVIAPTDIFDFQTVKELAQHIELIDQEDSHQAEVFYGKCKLNPIQKWFFAEHTSCPNHWNQIFKFENIKSDVENLKAAINKLVLRHEALRSRYEFVDGDWSVTIGQLAPQVFQRYGITSDPSDFDAEVNQVLERESSGMDLKDGPLFKAVFIESPTAEQNQLILIAHHLVVDAVSWQILIQEIELLLLKKDVNSTISTPWHSWVEHLNDAEKISSFAEDLEFWRAQKQNSPLPVDSTASTPITENEVGSISTILSSSDTERLLYNSQSAYGTKVDELLILAVAATFTNNLDCPDILLGLERHGRDTETKDLTGTVGWCTNYFPVKVELPESKDLGIRIKLVKEILRSVPNNGLSFGVLKYLSEHANKFSEEHRPKIIFNYLGEQAALRTEQLGAGEMVFAHARSPLSERYHLIEINATLEAGRLRVRWDYSLKHYQSTTINRIGEEFTQVIREIIDHCSGQQTRTFSPSDFPDLEIDADDLDELFDQIK